MTTYSILKNSNNFTILYASLYVYVFYIQDLIFDTTYRELISATKHNFAALEHKYGKNTLIHQIKTIQIIT